MIKIKDGDNIYYVYPKNPATFSAKKYLKRIKKDRKKITQEKFLSPFESKDWIMEPEEHLKLCKNTEFTF